MANVCQTCGRVQGRLRALALPAVITSPAQHSGSRGQRAPAPGTDAAGHPLVTVGIPSPAEGAANGPPLAGAAGAPVPAPGERTRAPTTAAAATSRTTPAAAASNATGRRRRAGMGGTVPPGPRPGSRPGSVPAGAGPAEGMEYGGDPGAADDMACAGGAEYRR